MTTIAIIDYEVGNIRSILSSFEKVGAKPVLTRDHQEILNADGVVLPGVGSYSHGMGKLKEYELDLVIREYAVTGKPILGICLGMQLLLSESEEFGRTEGLGLIPGVVRGLDLLDAAETKLPHISWAGIQAPKGVSWRDTILDGILAEEDMYFVHSFMAVPTNSRHVLSLTTYSNSQFCSAVKKANVYGCQFHPEKSAQEGLRIISNFIRICGVK